MFDVIKGPGGPCGFDMTSAVGCDTGEPEVLIMGLKSLEDGNTHIIMNSVNFLWFECVCLCMCNQPYRNHSYSKRFYLLMLFL